MRVESASALRAKLFARRWNGIVAAPVPTFDVLDALRIAKRESRETPFIIVGAPLAGCVEFLRAGADECVMENEETEMGAITERALQRAETQQAQRLAERRFRSLIESLPQSIILHRDRRDPARGRRSNRHQAGARQDRTFHIDTPGIAAERNQCGDGRCKCH